MKSVPLQSTIVIFILLFIEIISIVAYPKIKRKDINNLRIELREIIDASSFEPEPDSGITGEQPLIGSTVRLAFHDCVGRNIKQDSSSSSSSSSSSLSSSDDQTDQDIHLTINRCNGCFDFDEPDNFGLEENVFNTLEDMYQTSDNQWYKKMSRADFWMACATAALEYAAENQFTVEGSARFGVPSPLRDITYYFGREDCLNSPYAVEKDVFSFPSALAGFKETSQFFLDNLGFNERETVVILGAHTLGRSHTESSGYISQWVGLNHVLNNEYYALISHVTGNIFAIEWIQSKVKDVIVCTEQNQCPNLDLIDLTQWIVNGPPELVGEGLHGIGLFLNSDISLALKIEDHLDRESGIVTCTPPTFAELIGGYELDTRCPAQQGISQIVDQFSLDNALWINEFADVFEKMIIINEDLTKLQQLIVPYDRSVEDEYFNSVNSALGTNHVNQPDINHEYGDQSQDNNYYYYIGAATMIFILIFIITTCIMYHKRKSNVLSRQIKDSLIIYGSNTQNTF